MIYCFKQKFYRGIKMIIEEEKVEIVEDENMSSTKEKSKKTKKKKNESKKSDGNVAIKDKVDEQNDLKNNDENPNNENKSANQILENTVDNDDISSSDNNQVEANVNVDTTTKNDNKKTFSEEPLNEEDNIETDEDYKSHKSKSVLSIILIILSVFLVLVLIAFGALTFYNYKNKNVIAKGVSINSIDLSYCTKDEAKERINNYYTEQLLNDITLVYNDYKTFIKTAEIELNYDIDSAVDYAFSYGKNGNVFQDDYHILASLIKNKNITPVYTLNQELLTKFLNNISTELPGAIIESSHYIDGNKLIITKGTPGNVVNIESTTNNIKSQLTNLSYINNPITIEVKTQTPKDINVEEIYKDIHKEPKDAYYTKDPYSIFPSENGIDFKISIDEVKQLVQNSEAECEVPLKVLYPNVTTNMIGQEAFPDLLGSFSTNYVSNPDRTTNLRLAANKINGTVLMPGEVFSYNGIVGERTISAGYKNAAIYQNGEVVDGLGGGICQISTTLYNAALFANLEMVELYNHQFVPSYVTAGRDATVVYGVKDFKFKNSRKYAIKITCSVSGGVAKFQIWGVKEPTEYDVSVYANVSRTASYIKATTYRTLKLNGETVKTEKIANSTYKVH
ncbi:MAG TPA: hypothetical protein DEP51_03560 [Clostridiales bacterium]|nr:hypothetical protein [Clostridiales bacterium]